MKWFKHKANASKDEFIAELKSVFGLEGYGRWWVLLETIAEQMGESDKCSVSYPWTDWQRFLAGKRGKLQAFLEYCQDKQKISLKQSGNILEVTCPKLLELRDEYSRKKRKSPEQDKDTDKGTDKEAESKKEIKKPEPAQAPPDFKKIIFTTGMNMIGGESKRSLVGKWLRDYGEANVVTAFLACEKNRPLNPVEYVEGILKKTGKSPGLFDKPKFDPAKDISGYKVL